MGGDEEGELSVKDLGESGYLIFYIALIFLMVIAAVRASRHDPLPIPIEARRRLRPRLYFYLFLPVLATPLARVLPIQLFHLIFWPFFVFCFFLGIRLVSKEDKKARDAARVGVPEPPFSGDSSESAKRLRGRCHSLKRLERSLMYIGGVLLALQFLSPVSPFLKQYSEQLEAFSTPIILLWVLLVVLSWPWEERLGGLDSDELELCERAGHASVFCSLLVVLALLIATFRSAIPGDAIDWLVRPSLLLLFMVGLLRMEHLRECLMTLRKGRALSRAALPPGGAPQASR
jgi:hypothetical protein